MTWGAWDSADAWDRYSYTHAQVLHDPDGVIAPLVAEKGRVPPERRQAFVDAALDAFINSALKCARRGNALCVLMEAVEAVRHALVVLFGLEGRMAPFPAYLQYELRVYPLASSPLTGDELLDLLTRDRRPGRRRRPAAADRNDRCPRPLGGLQGDP